MLLPSIFEDNFVDRFFDDFFTVPTKFKFSAGRLMDTNIKDQGKEYMMEVELPGFDKKDVKAELKDGYLTISAERQEAKEEKDRKDRYLRRERYSGSCRRSFYVGKNLKEEDFKASFDKGVLQITFPKPDNTAKIEDQKYISID